MSEIYSFRIKRRYVLGLGRWLAGLSLYGRESRERTKFIEFLSSEMQENEAMRLEIVKKYAELGEGEELKVVKENDGSSHYVVPDDKMDEFNKEIADYFDEDMVMEGEGYKNRLKIIKDIVLNTNEKIGPEIAGDYDHWCEAFEKVEI